MLNKLFCVLIGLQHSVFGSIVYTQNQPPVRGRETFTQSTVLIPDFLTRSQSSLALTQQRGR